MGGSKVRDLQPCGVPSKRKKSAIFFELLDPVMVYDPNAEIEMKTEKGKAKRF